MEQPLHVNPYINPELFEDTGLTSLTWKVCDIIINSIHSKLFAHRTNRPGICWFVCCYEIWCMNTCICTQTNYLLVQRKITHLSSLGREVIHFSNGNKNAAVFPLPVSATPIMSRFCRPIGMACLWIGVGSCQIKAFVISRKIIHVFLVFFILFFSYSLIFLTSLKIREQRSRYSLYSYMAHKMGDLSRNYKPWHLKCHIEWKN
jgi:hypothetical protein